ncbi:MAG: MBL fold metallo-hydrolase [Opitutae bacterium]|nr:MBL fold metallo-hydrolase [Opitutae bacterium]MCD8299229.1 MBL fold metallo-hydrolase [Opitutae bacterium]
MEILFLGTGTSQGVPMIGVEPIGLDLENPKNWRGRSCAHLVIDGVHVQIDAGPEFRMACLKNRVPAVDYFFLTHEHSDHILGMDDLRSFCAMRGGRAIPVYSTKSGVKRVRTIFDYGIRENSGDGYIAFSTHELKAPFRLPSGTLVEFVILPHGRKIRSAGLVFTEKCSGKRLAYYTDCASVPAEAVELARGCDILVIDALRQWPHPTHLSIEQALEISREIGAKRTFFIHMTWQVDHETWNAKLPAGTELAFDGLRVFV